MAGGAPTSRTLRPDESPFTSRAQAFDLRIGAGDEPLPVVGLVGVLTTDHYLARRRIAMLS